jgi:hypothetical protein
MQRSNWKPNKPILSLTKPGKLSGERRVALTCEIHDGMPIYPLIISEITDGRMIEGRKIITHQGPLAQPIGPTTSYIPTL